LSTELGIRKEVAAKKRLDIESPMLGLLARTELSLMRRGRAMKKYREVLVGFDTAKKKHAVAVAEVGRKGKIRYFGEIESSPAAVEKLVKKLGERYAKLRVCYEAGPTGYGLYR
jgi:hypothetical protein